MKDRTCCFIGHRKIEDSLELRTKLRELIEAAIVTYNIDTFLFGSKSEFDSLCHTLTTELEEKYPHIKRVYVRAEYPHIDDSYKAYLLQFYEETYFPKRIISAGKAAYIKRNREMIDNSSLCIVYYNEAENPKSGTRFAIEYAAKKNKTVINLTASS